MRIWSAILATLIGTMVLTLTACGGGSASPPGASTPGAPTPPAAAAWRVTGSLQTDRSGHTATELANGKVLVVGGFSRQGDGQTSPGAPLLYLSSVELYDPATKLWTRAAALAIGRLSHTATVLPSGKVMVAGGVNASGPTASVEVYDPANNTWALGPPLATTRLKHTATVLPSGKVLVMGGYDNFGNPRGSVELYDPATNSWAITATPTIAFGLGTSSLLPNGKLLFVRGYKADFATSPSLNAELYDPATNTWTLAGTLTTAHEDHSATVLPNGMVLVTGGGYTSVHSATLFATDLTELYDPSTNTWSVSTPLAIGPRVGHTASLLRTGGVLVVGGTQALGWMYQRTRADAALYELL